MVQSYKINPIIVHSTTTHTHTHTPGVVNGGKICQSYFSDGIVVLWGSLVMANAVETYGLHRRFAVSLLSYTGCYNV
jgi:di/tricarboxylate transporter